MNNYALAAVWLSGDMPFRPRWLAQEFVLRTVSRWPAARVARFVADLAGRYDGASAIALGFALQLDGYARSPDVWRIHRINECEKQRAINECRRGPGGVILRSVAGPGAAWSVQ